MARCDAEERDVRALVLEGTQVHVCKRSDLREVRAELRAAALVMEMAMAMMMARVVARVVATARGRVWIRVSKGAMM